jgi:exodeoxyribonuclease-1
LQTDPESLRPLSQDKLAKRLSQSPKSVRRLKSNASPIVMPFEDAPEMAVAKTLGREELERRAQILAGDEDLRQRLISAAEQSRETKLPSLHVEEQIYDNFYSQVDEALLLAFHDISWEKRLQVIAKLEDARLRKLGLRLVYFERPELLTDTVRKSIANETTQRLVREPVADAWLTLSDAIREVDGLIATATDEKRTCLQEHRQFLLDRSKYLTKVE